MSYPDFKKNKRQHFNTYNYFLNDRGNRIFKKAVCTEIPVLPIFLMTKSFSNMDVYGFGKKENRHKLALSGL